MAGVYAVTGKLGTGKTKFAVWRAQMALREGRRVAGNVNLNLEKIMPGKRCTYTRIPDKPTAADFEALGRGAEGEYVEDDFGVLLLDELGTWLNARSFQDKSRQGVLDWLIHARKKRWEVYMIVQDAGMIDKQARDSLIEYECTCLRLDKISIPIIGAILREIAMAVFGLKAKRVGYLPRMHTVTARLGNDAKVVAEKWWYRGDDLHVVYDTEQEFSMFYPHGVHSVLPPWEFQPAKPLGQRLREWLEGALGQVGFVPLPRPLPRPKSPAMSLISRLPEADRIKWTKYYLARMGTQAHAG